VDFINPLAKRFSLVMFIHSSASAQTAMPNIID